MHRIRSPDLLPLRSMASTQRLHVHSSPKWAVGYDTVDSWISLRWASSHAEVH